MSVSLVDEISAAFSLSPKLGSGFDSVLSEFRPKALLNVETKLPPSPQITTFFTQEFKESKELYEKLAISASARASLYTGSLDARFSSISSFERTEFTRLVVGSINVVNQKAVSLHDQVYSLRPDLKKLINGQDHARVDEFYRLAGDQVVWEQQTGGNVTAIFKYSYNSLAEMKNVNADLTVGIKFLSGAANGTISVASEFKSLFNKSNLTYEIFVNGSVVRLPSPENLAEYLLKFPESVQQEKGSAIVLKNGLLSWSKVPGFNAHTQFDQSRNIHLLDELGRAYSEASEKLATVRSILASPERFEPFEQSTLKGGEELLLNLKKQIKKSADTIVKSAPAPSKEPDALLWPQISIPQAIAEQALYVGTSGDLTDVVTTNRDDPRGSTKFIGYTLREGVAPKIEAGELYAVPEASALAGGEVASHNRHLNQECVSIGKSAKVGKGANLFRGTSPQNAAIISTSPRLRGGETEPVGKSYLG